MRRTLTFRSPAKLNLYLKILNKRKDGYHNLVTLFERINLVDDIKLSPNKVKKIRVFCKHPDVPTDSRNLVHKVARLLKEEFSLEDGVDITITKRIPVAAGLAGGSSNAATTLMGLNMLWKLSLTKPELVKFAKKIGADVPFFLENCSWGLGTDRGDIIKNISIKTKLWHILVVPKKKMLTKKVYNGLSKKRPKGQNLGKKGPHTNVLTKQGDNVNILIRNLRKNDLSKVGRFLLNDLEFSAFRLCPNLLELKNNINLYTKGAALSGSGPTIFGLAESKKQAERLKAIFAKRYSRVFVVRTF